jgi:restriction system protein
MELTPIAPVIRLDTNDRRFVDGREVLGNMVGGMNLASMDWEDFEHLCRQLFEKAFSASGAEVKVTQASRDQGVDAIIFDPDPLRGGKIVVQAKRYTNVVDVSAVRDLYGTVHNEGAIKGILVTTSHFGPDSYSFAKDKPLTLLDGGQLLGLLEQHGYKFRIDLAEAKRLL